MLSEGLSQEHSGTGFAAASGTLSSGLTGHGGTHTHRDGFKLPSDLSVVGPPTLESKVLSVKVVNGCPVHS